MDNTQSHAQILVETLPYIQRFAGKTIVIKYGGSAMVSDELAHDVMTDVVLLTAVGIRVVLVHGGGKEISHMLDRVGLESKFVDGLRYTDDDTMEIVQMVLAGKINKDLVALLNSCGGKGLGICGVDGSTLSAEKKKDGPDLGNVGEITNVDPTLINNALSEGFVPIIASIAEGIDGRSYNINADTAASKIASEMHSEKLILMTDVKGLLRDKDDESTLISSINASEVPALKKQGIIKGGMIPKTECCVEAARRGVSRTHIIDGRIPHSILIELFSDKGIGTMIVN